MDAASVASVSARASGENFPVASLLFPRSLRPHLRRVYGYCRLVDILGDEAEGDRLALLDELEREVEACYGGPPPWPGLRGAPPTHPGGGPPPGAPPPRDSAEPNQPQRAHA